MMCLGVGFLASILFGTLCFLNLYVYFLSLFFQIAFQFLVLSLLLLACLWCDCWIPMKLSQRLLTLSSFFRVFFLLIVLIDCFLLPYVPNHWFDSLLHQLQSLQLTSLGKSSHGPANSEQGSTTRGGCTQPTRRAQPEYPAWVIGGAVLQDTYYIKPHYQDRES